MTDRELPHVLTPQGSNGATYWLHGVLAILVAILVVLVVYQDTAASMVAIWQRSDTFAHGFVIPVVVAWLIWQKRRLVMQHVPRPSYGALPLLLASGGMWLLGVLASANSPAQFALVLTLVLLVPAIAGFALARALIFPLGFLFFAVPVGEFLLPQLMSATASFVVTALRATGIPVYQVGQELVIPSGNWSVVEACSGIRYLIASLMIGTLYAYISYRSITKRLLFMAFAAVVPIIANWLRAYLIVIIGHLSNNRLATGVDHLVYGWLFFGVVMAVMFWVGSRWDEHHLPEPEIAHVSSPVAAVSAASPLAIWGACLVVVAVAVLPRLMYLGAERESANSQPVSLASLEVAGWQSTKGELTSWTPVYQGASAETAKIFDRDGKKLGLYLSYYRNQNFGRKMVTSTNVLVRADNPDWKVVATGKSSVFLGDKEISVRVTEMVSERREQKLRIWHWYWIGGVFTTNDALAKAYTGWLRLSGQGDDSAVIMVYAPVDQAGQTDQLLADFLKDFSVRLEPSLRQTRGR